MSKSKLRGKYDEDTTQLHRRSQSASLPYKKGPPGRANGGATEDARKDKVEGPPVSLLEKDKGERSAEPGRPSVQVHFEESWPRHLITLHLCIWREPTSKTINKGPLPLISHTHTHTHTIPHPLSLKALSCS
jgi:hypothetical protein